MVSLRRADELYVTYEYIEIILPRVICKCHQVSLDYLDVHLKHGKVRDAEDHDGELRLREEHVRREPGPPAGHGVLGGPLRGPC